MDQADERRALAARELWGCRRPDKFHRLDEQSALRGLRAAERDLPSQEGIERSVYRCCDAGWVWGRHGSRPQVREVDLQA